MIDLSKLAAHPSVRCRGLGEDGGAFEFTGPAGKRLRVIASAGLGWEHVSISVETRIPLWTEMSWVHRVFFPAEAAMQLHVPPAEHIDCHPRTLHLWRPTTAPIPRPPGFMV